jgi:hypothetical protein
LCRPRSKNIESQNTDLAVAGADKTGEISVIPNKVDSFDILFYIKPFSDSTRYTRYFKISHASDSVTVNEMNKIFRSSFIKLTEVKKCQSEGKIIVPVGGEVFRVIYFSRTGADCAYLYYIKDGEFYYYEMSPLLNEKLNAFEKVAVEAK